MYKHLPLITSVAVISLLSACASTPEPEVVEIEPPKIEQTCTSVNLLTKQVIPAVTKSGTSITSIESPPEYIYNEETGKTEVYQAPPIERKEPWVKVIKPEEVIYVNAEGQQVTDICEFKNEAAGPAIGDLPPPPDPN